MHRSIYPVLAAQTKLPFYVSGAGITDPEYHVRRENGLTSYQILYTRSGAGVLLVDGKELQQSTGSIFFLSPGVPHEYMPTNGTWETAWVVFRGQHLADVMKELGFGSWHYRENADLSACESIFRRILSAVGDPLSGGERCSLLAYEYILEVRSLLVAGRSSGGGAVGGALEYMDANFSRDLTLEELACLTGVSLQHFCRVFRAQTGMRPMEYLARRRIAEAKRLLSSTELSVGEISELCGYSNPTYFGTVFRRLEGTSPTEYRRMRIL